MKARVATRIAGSVVGTQAFCREPTRTGVQLRKEVHRVINEEVFKEENVMKARDLAQISACGAGNQAFCRATTRTGVQSRKEVSNVGLLQTGITMEARDPTRFVREVGTPASCRKSRRRDRQTWEPG